MVLLDRFLPQSRVREIDRRAVDASVEQAWDSIRHIDLYRLGFVRALFSLRTFPDWMAAKISGREFTAAEHATLEDIVRPEHGFHLLCEEPGRGFVVGAIGTFWKPHIDFQDFIPDGFAAYSEPGFGKVAWSIEVAPRPNGGSWISVEVRVTTTDEASLHSFERYWTFIGPFSHAIRRAMLDVLQRDLGPATPDTEPMPGDEFLPGSPHVRTHSTVIEAPPERVWPWLAQMGGDRAGWYAIDALDHKGKPSATRIHPEWQDIAEGDLIAALPGSDNYFGVLRLEPNRALVLGSPSLRVSGPFCDADELPFRVTWAFVLERVGEDATLLRARVRVEVDDSLPLLARHGWELLAHEVMQREQLANLKKRAEKSGGLGS
jgi:hypothetical protein